MIPSEVCRDRYAGDPPIFTENRVYHPGGACADEDMASIHLGRIQDLSALPSLQDTSLAV